MDNPTQEPNVFITRASLPFMRFAIPIICLIIGAGIGFGINQLLPAKKIVPASSLPTKESIQIPEANLPISVALLKNPIVYQWSGSVEGTLIAKSEDSITIKDEKGNTIEIPTWITSKEKKNTLFVDPATYKAGSKQSGAKLDDIPLGSYLRGNFFVIPGNKNQIIGGTFTVVKKDASKTK